MSASGQKRENMSKEPTWQTETTVWSADRTVEFKLVGTEVSDHIEVCAFWLREGDADSAPHLGSQVLGSYFERNGAIDFIANHIAAAPGALRLIAGCELDKATFCKLCQVELKGDTDKNLLMRSPISAVIGDDVMFSKGDMVVLCDACYGSMKSIQANK